MRPSSYLVGSIIAAVAVVWHAFATRQQYFPSMVYLSSSKLSVAIIGNLGFAIALNGYKFLTWAFFGTLRDAEVERINDKISQAIIETLLAMTIFRQDFTIGFFAAFVVLSFVKIFHWMVQDRVDFIETTPNVSRAQHLRIISFILLLLSVDYYLLRHALAITLTRGVSIHLLFAFEYAIQASTAIIVLAKYVLSMVDMALEGRWEGKGVAVFYIELALDLLHLITYTAFFGAVFTTYGIPIHLVRDLYWTFRNFQNRVRDFLRYRRVAAIMDHRFPDATPEDLDRADHVCIVCREEMGPGSRAKKLDCSHSFHLHCLRSWLERQQNCPICRAPVLATVHSTPINNNVNRNGGGVRDGPRIIHNVDVNNNNNNNNNVGRQHEHRPIPPTREEQEQYSTNANETDPALQDLADHLTQMFRNNTMVPNAVMPMYPQGITMVLSPELQSQLLNITNNNADGAMPSLSQMSGSAVPVITVPVLVPLVSHGIPQNIALQHAGYGADTINQHVTLEQHAMASAIAAAATAAAAMATPVIALPTQIPQSSSSLPSSQQQTGHCDPSTSSNTNNANNTEGTSG